MIKEISSLRFIFIFFIFLHHVALFDGGGTMAVAFFFVLGGFALTLGYKDKVLKDDFSYKAFIKKRAIKFYPLHWCLLVISAVPIITLHFKLWQIPTFFINALLVQTWFPIKQIYFSYNAVSWYLADTMFLAFVFPFLFKFIAKADTKKRIIFAVGCAVVYTLLIIFLPTKDRHAILYINPLVRTFDFIIGIYLALGFIELKENLKIQTIISNHYHLITFICFALIILLVVIANVLNENQRLITAFYWLPIAILIVVTSLLGNTYGGGV